MWWKDLTEEELRAAYKNMKPWSEYRDSFDAAKCRQESDWLLGLNATRGQTIAMRAQGGEGVFSIGRVQTPTLVLIAERERDAKLQPPPTRPKEPAPIQAEAAFIAAQISPAA